VSYRSLDYVKRVYGVPVRRGMRVVHEGDSGVVTCGDAQYVRVRFDGDRHSCRCHPLSLDYGDGIKPADRLAEQNAAIDAWNDQLNGRGPVESSRTVGQEPGKS
jgi:hypothetical protein